MNKEYVEKAEKVINKLKNELGTGKIELTTSQIRKFLAGVNVIHNKVQLLSLSGGLKENKLTEEIQNELQALKVRLIYQCGKDKKVKAFEKEAGLIDFLDRIQDSRQAFEQFCGYVEALVAYHKFEGGRD